MSGLRRLPPPLLRLLLVGLVGLSLAYLVPRPQRLDLGDLNDGGHTAGFYRREITPDGASYRWSSGHSTLVLHGLGNAPLLVDLQLSSGRVPGDPPVPLSIYRDGALVATLSLDQASRLYPLSLPTTGLLSTLTGDLTLEFRAPTTRQPNDSRDLGFVADFVVARPQGPSLPPPAQLIYLLGAAALLYALARRLGWRAWVGLTLAGGLLMAAVAGLVLARIWLTVFSARLFLLLLFTHLLVWLVGGATRAVARRMLGGRVWSPGDWGWRLFLSLFAVSLLLKLGGLLYPPSFVVDAEFHLRMLERLVDGTFPDQHALAFSVMPADEWKQRVFIPYSPFFYYLFAPLYFLPWSLEDSVRGAAGLLDVLRVPLVYLLALRLGPGQRRALTAAALFTFIPATYVVQQFGNWPTQVSLWLTLAWLVVVVLNWERLHRPGPFLLAAGVGGLVLLSYTVTAGYIGLIFGSFVLVGLAVARGARRPFVALLLSSALGLGLALLVFYGAYLGEFLTQSLPTLLDTTTAPGGSGGSVTTRPGGVPGFLQNVVARQVQSYALAGVFALGLGGLALAGSEWRARRRGVTPRPARRSWAAGLLLAWTLSLPLFTAADYVVDQAFKEYWFALSALAVLGGAWLLALVQRGRAGAALVALLGGYLGWASLSLWVFRLFFH